MTSRIKITDDLLWAHAKDIESVLRTAYCAAVIEHARLGFSVPDWQNGHVVHVPPEQVLKNLPESTSRE